MPYAIGIDLGTSNSVVAVVKDGKPVVIADEEGNRTQASVVCFGHGQSVVVGAKARRQMHYDFRFRGMEELRPFTVRNLVQLFRDVGAGPLLVHFEVLCKLTYPKLSFIFSWQQGCFPGRFPVVSRPLPPSWSSLG